MSENIEHDEREYEDGIDLIVPGTKRRTEILFRIRAELNKESDRGCALVAAAYLENEINELLSGFFVEQGVRARTALFDFNGPVGTFSSKIKMSAALGLIPEEIHKALDVIRKIRNEFAHLHEPLDFESPNIRQQVMNLLPGLNSPKETVRENFILKIQSIAATVHLCIAHTAPRQAPEYEQVPLREDASEQRIELAARRFMKITAPEITYEQAVEMVLCIKEIK